MTVLSFLSSYVLVLLGCLAPLIVPFALIYPRFFGLSRAYCMLAIMGAQIMFLYLKPDFVPLWMVPAATAVLAVAANRALKGGREPFTHVFGEPLVWALFAYCFLLFFFRWEPPGSEPTKWGALARVLQETQRISSEAGPTSIRDFRGASLGIPLMMALSHVSSAIPWERLVSFYECLCLMLFVCCLGNALMTWFSRRASMGASLLVLVLFTYPQSFLSWGGAPTLVGMIGGFTLLEVTKILLVRRILFREIAFFGFVLAFTLHSHLPGFFVSVLTCLPVIAWLMLASKRKAIVLSGVSRTFLAGLLVFAPFFFRWSFKVGFDDIMGMRKWHEKMAPYLFEKGVGMGILWHVRVSIWEVAAVIVVVLFLSALILEWKQRFLVPFLVSLLATMLLMVNVKLWWLPMSYLLSPEAVSAALIFPMAMPLAWVLGQFESRSMTAQRAAAAAVLVLSLVSILQFKNRMLPLLFKSRMTQKDRDAIALIESKVPWQECIQVKAGESGMWIPVLALRCTVVAEGDDRDIAGKPRAPWVFLSDLETGLPLMGGELVFDDGARLIKRASAPSGAP